MGILFVKIGLAASELDGFALASSQRYVAQMMMRERDSNTPSQSAASTTADKWSATAPR
jgi:hypothetical protein